MGSMPARALGDPEQHRHCQGWAGMWLLSYREEQGGPGAELGKEPEGFHRVIKVGKDLWVIEPNL